MHTTFVHVGFLFLCSFYFYISATQLGFSCFKHATLSRRDIFATTIHNDTVLLFSSFLSVCPTRASSRRGSDLAIPPWAIALILILLLLLLGLLALALLKILLMLLVSLQRHCAITCSYLWLHDMREVVQLWQSCMAILILTHTSKHGIL